MQLIARTSKVTRAINCISGIDKMSKSQIAEKPYVIYARVSTQKQGISQLGLDAQREAVAGYLAPLPHQVIGEYIETESGKKADRPQLLAALELCRRRKAILVIAKLDRLARNVHFISGLMESGVDFVAVDNVHANRLMLHMLAAFAEWEREQIGQRTKAALAAAKARGTRLGANGHNLARRRKAEALERARLYYPMIQELLVDLRSYTAVAARLNAMGLASPCGGKWWANNVRLVMFRSKAADEFGDCTL